MLISRSSHVNFSSINHSQISSPSQPLRRPRGCPSCLITCDQSRQSHLVSLGAVWTQPSGSWPDPDLCARDQEVTQTVTFVSADLSPPPPINHTTAPTSDIVQTPQFCSVRILLDRSIVCIFLRQELRASSTRINRNLRVAYSAAKSDQR